MYMYYSSIQTGVIILKTDLKSYILIHIYSCIYPVPFINDWSLPDRAERAANISVTIPAVRVENKYTPDDSKPI